MQDVEIFYLAIRLLWMYSFKVVVAYVGDDREREVIDQSTVLHVPCKHSF
jgi:hypothetical protein